MFILGHALRAAPGEYLDKSQEPMRARWVWYLCEASASISLRRGAKAAVGSVTKEAVLRVQSATADPMSASTLSGSAASARSKKPRACATLSGAIPLLSHAKP